MRLNPSNSFVCPAIQTAPSEDSEQIAQMCRLFWIFARCICPRVYFQTLWLNCINCFEYTSDIVRIDRRITWVHADNEDTDQVQKDIIICENDISVAVHKEVCNIFYDFFFVNVAENTGNDSIPVNKICPSILKINENVSVNSELNIKLADEKFIHKQIDKWRVKRANVIENFDTYKSECCTAYSGLSKQFIFKFSVPRRLQYSNGCAYT